MSRLPGLVMQRDGLARLPATALEFGYLVRACRPGDENTWHDIGEGRPLLGWTAARFSREVLNSRDFDPSGLFFVTYGSRPAGVACAWKRSGGGKVGELRFLAVKKSHRGKGLGSFLVVKVLEYLRKAGCRSCEARLNVSQARALKALLSLGFRPACAGRGDKARWQRALRRIGAGGAAAAKVRPDHKPDSHTGGEGHTHGRRNREGQRARH